jgi:hypothetical protein
MKKFPTFMVGDTVNPSRSALMHTLRVPARFRWLTNAEHSRPEVG